MLFGSIWLRTQLYTEAKARGDVNPEDLEEGKELPVPDDDECFRIGWDFFKFCSCFCFWIPLVFFLTAASIDKNTCSWTFMGIWMQVFSLVAICILPMGMCSYHYIAKCTGSKTLWRKKERNIVLVPLVMIPTCSFGLGKQAYIEGCTHGISGAPIGNPHAAFINVTILIFVFFSFFGITTFFLFCFGDEPPTQVSASKINAYIQSLKCVPAEELYGDATQGHVTTFQALKDIDKGESTHGCEININNLEDALNENLLWHGTSKDAAEAIVHEHFRIPKGSEVLHGDRFGNGAYFAENIDKSLTYAKDENGTKYILLCRVTCGQYYYTELSSESSAHTTAEQAKKIAS